MGEIGPDRPDVREHSLENGRSRHGLGRYSVLQAPLPAAGPMFEVQTRCGGSRRDIKHESVPWPKSE